MEFDFQDFSFFNPSPNLREMQILRILASDPEVSQESIAYKTGIVPSMVNRYLKDFEERDLIIKEGINKRKMIYKLTENGKKRLQFLTVLYVSEVSRLYMSVNDFFSKVVVEINKNKIKKVILYGAGVVGKIVFNVMRSIGIEVLGFVDDAPSKHGEMIYSLPVYSPDSRKLPKYDAIIVASFRHSQVILEKAKKHNLKNIFIFKIDEMGYVSLFKAN